MLDLRKRAILAVKVKPKDSKANDFHTALADYLYKELRHQGLNVKRNSVNLKIKLDKLHDDKYDCIVVDCIAGKLFLRGKEVKDKFFGKLRRFEGSRPADAYYCVVQSATRITNRIKHLMNDLLDDNDEREIYAEEIERVDLRRKRIDMRKKAEITEIPSFTDVGDRKFALCYINGEIYFGETHAECINEYLQKNFNDGLSNIWNRPDIIEDGLAKYIQQYAFAHLINPSQIRLETDSLYNVDKNTVALALKKEYPNAVVYDDNRYDEIRDRYVKIADLRKNVIGETDYGDREKAIIYINGEILEGNFHAECIDKYLREHNLGQLANKQWRPSIFVKNPDVGSDEWIIQQNIKQLAFAHLMNNGSVHLETDSLYNIDENTVVLALKAKYNTEIFDDNKYDSIRDRYKKIAKDMRRQAEFYGGIIIQDKFLECYKNPTVSEFKELKKENSDLRMILSKDGTLYVWNANLWHAEAIKLFNIPNDIHLYTDDGILIIYTGNIEKKDLIEAFRNNTSLFNGIDKNLLLEFDGPYYNNYHFKSIQEILDGEETTYNEQKNAIKINRLKKAELIDAFRKRDEYIEVFRNPTASEMEGVKDPYYMGFKGAITKDGELYVWSVHIAHDDINDYIKTPIDVSYIRVYGENSILYISGNKDVDFEDLKIYLNKYTNLFTNRYQYNLYGFSNIGDYEIKTNEFQSIDEILQVFN